MLNSKNLVMLSKHTNITGFLFGYLMTGFTYCQKCKISFTVVVEFSQKVIFQIGYLFHTKAKSTQHGCF